VPRDGRSVRGRRRRVRRLPQSPRELAAQAAFVLRNRPSRRLVTGRAQNQRRVSGIASEIADALGLDEARVRGRMHWSSTIRRIWPAVFFVSPFEDAAVCAIDGFGDFVSTSVARGSGRTLTMLDRVFFPHSLGLLYLALTQYWDSPNTATSLK